MQEDGDLALAKSAMEIGEWSKAIQIYEKLMENQLAKPTASYALGMLYEIREWPQDRDKAKTYYTVSEEAGNEMATYRIAGILYGEGKKNAAFSRFKLIHERNPSAAYWSYRIAQEVGGVKYSSEDVKYYLESAISQGHIVAERDDMLERLSGKRGIARIPRAIFDLVKWLFKAKSFVKDPSKKLFYK